MGYATPTEALNALKSAMGDLDLRSRDGVLSLSANKNAGGFDAEIQLSAATWDSCGIQAESMETVDVYGAGPTVLERVNFSGVTLIRCYPVPAQETT